MIDDLFPLISFVVITTFTPGPNNISSASMGVLHGFRKTLNFLFGIAAGFFLMMLVAAWVSKSLLGFFPNLEPTLRLVGAAYILYLAYATLKASITFAAKDVKPLGFGQGFLLQLLNPKLVVYGLTLFSTFLAAITSNVGWLLLSVLLLTLTAFSATSSWALFGTAIRTYLHQPRVQTIVNTILALLLVYTAIDLAGFI